MKNKFAVNVLSVLFLVLFVFLGCSISADSYYPLNQGLVWEYQMSFGSMMGDKEQSKIVMTNFASRELKGVKVTPQKIDAQGQSSFEFLVDDSNGVYIYAKQGSGDVDPAIENNNKSKNINGSILANSICSSNSLCFDIFSIFS